MLVEVPKKTLTLTEFLALPETQPASEYIDGEISQKPMPQGEHSAIQGELTSRINAILKPQKLGWALPELRCTFGGGSIVPDIAVFTWKRIPRKENGTIANIFTIAPDWTIEILSPDQSQTKVIKKILNCLKYGTEIGWLIDPHDRSVFVYFPTQSTAVFDDPELILPVPSFAKQFRFTLGDLFNILSFDLEEKH
jgi:Uma2 family endonuclease